MLFAMLQATFLDPQKSQSFVFFQLVLQLRWRTRFPLMWKSTCKSSSLNWWRRSCTGWRESASMRSWRLALLNTGRFLFFEDFQLLFKTKRPESAKTPIWKFQKTISTKPSFPRPSFLLRNQCNLYEGSVVRVIRRLEELIRELATAAKTIGNEELASKLGEGGAYGSW